LALVGRTPGGVFNLPVEVMSGDIPDKKSEGDSTKEFGLAECGDDGSVGSVGDIQVCGDLPPPVLPVSSVGNGLAARTEQKRTIGDSSLDSISSGNFLSSKFLSAIILLAIRRGVN